MDYVIKQDRGKAIALSIVGVSLGTITSLQVLFRFIKDLEVYTAWSIMSGTLIFFSFGLAIIVKEPVDIEKSPDRICK